MKKFYFASLLLAVAATSQAQEDPETRLLLHNLWPSIAAHDSIAYYSDSGATPDYMTEITFFSDGNIDSALTYEYPSTLSRKYIGTQTGNTTEIFYVDFYSGTPDTLAKYIIISDHTSRDSVMQVYFGESEEDLVLEQEYRAIYNANNTMDQLEIYADNGSGNLEKASSYIFYYTGTRVDSMAAELDFFGIPLKVAVFDNEYDVNGKLVSTDIISIDPFEGTRYTESKVDFGHNNLDEVDEVFISYYDSTASSWMMEERWKYLKRNNSTISVDENTLLSEIYPNPVKDILHISGATERFSSYELIRTNGQVVERGVFTETLDMSRLSKGFYILRLIGNKDIQVQRVQKF